MKKIQVILSIVTILFFSSCGKKDDATPSSTPQETALQMTLTDDLGNLVSGASVKLYSSQNDLTSGTNQVGTTQTSASDGKVKFTGLSNIRYYWLAQKTCQDNVNGAVTTTNAIPLNQTTAINVVLTRTGTLTFVSNSSNPYAVYVNNQLVISSMAGNTTRTITFAPIGSYTIRVEQLSGFAISPTIRTYNGTLTCGGTLTTTFPN
ncbi:MAG: hypothetical protein EAZ44_10575 [Cytophagia bacterium]|nr:MAG: hypothetical protein EAZ44_10575 [Cytophagia bacterium]TAG40672.1 MAG: hypothetical protein EAZ31_08205 [Cytophagia bacterium]